MFVAVARGVAAVVCTGSAAVLLAACGGSGGSDSAPSSPAAVPASVRTATCASWTAASAQEHSQLVAGMREFFGGQVDSPGMVGTVLPDDRAIRLFDSYCAKPYAAAFSLYRLYGNAAAFTNPQK